MELVLRAFENVVAVFVTIGGESAGGSDGERILSI